MKPNPHPVPSSVRKKFFDSFDRDDTTDNLGFTESGSRWDAIRGIFRIFANRAVAVSDNSEYPLATVTMPYEDVEINLGNIDNGSAAALWVTGSGDWWAVGLDQEAVDCNCDQGTQCDRWNAKNCARRNNSNCKRWFCSSYSGNNRGNCIRFNSTNFTCNGYTTNYRAFCFRWDSFGRCTRVGFISVPTCNRWTTQGGNCREYAWNANNCTGNSCDRWNSTNCIAYNAETCNRWFEFTFNCQTCYPQYIRILQSIGNNISTVFSKVISRTFRTVSSTYGSLTLFEQDDLNDPVAGSMTVKTSGSQIEVDAYVSNNFQDKINVDEVITYTPTNAEITTQYGIMIKPSEYNQDNFIGDIDIDKNF